MGFVDTLPALPALSPRLERSLQATSTLSIAELFNEGKSSANDKTEWPMAAILEVLDRGTCPLCEYVHGMVLTVGSPEYLEWKAPSHINCRRTLVYIHRDEGREPDFEAPSPELIAKYGHYHVEPDKYAELRVPAEPSGRNIVVRRVKNLTTGQTETRLDWSPWSEQVPAWKRELVLKARVTTDPEQLAALLKRLDLTDLSDPAQLRQATLLGLYDRLQGWITVEETGSGATAATVRKNDA